MKTRKLITLVLATVIVASALVQMAWGFRIEGSLDRNLLMYLLPPATNIFTGQIPGNGVIPAPQGAFLHWDLREFPSCQIPYSFHDGTPDIAGTAEFDQCDTSFQAWENTTPARVRFTRVLPGPGAGRPLVIDGNNMIGWDGFTQSGSDSCLVAAGCACYGAVAASADIVGPGADNWLVTIANNCCDDQYVNIGGGVFQLQAGADGIITTTPQGDDVYLLGAYTCYFNAGANANIIGAGVNGVFNTTANNCCDDNMYSPAANVFRIRDGGDGVITTLPGDLGTTGPLALTGVFYTISTGIISEADVLFNDRYTWGIGAHAANGTLWDVRGVATHEFGHFVGIHHPRTGNLAGADGADGLTETMHPFVLPRFGGNTFQRTLHTDDQDAVNFLYSPDLGDSPDGPYTSNVHGGAAGRTLNGLTLETPLLGPEHLFGLKTLQPARNYTYEWIGFDVDSECESEQVNADPYDDGIILHPFPAARGAGFAVDVRINTGVDAEGNAHDYATTPMYLNIWADWNGNGVFEAGAPEQLAGPGDAIQMAGLYTRGGIVPLGAVDPVWIRVRLDWGEDAGAANNRDGTLAGPLGAAQFGEVSDTLVPVVNRQQDWDLGDLDPCNYPTLDANPAHILSGCAWLGPCITPEPAPNYFDLDGCDDGVVFLGLPWEPCTPVTIEVFVSVSGLPGCTPTDIFYFNFWKDGNLDRDFCDVTCAPEWCVANVPVFAAGNPWIFTFPDPGGYPFPPYSLAARARLSSSPLSIVPGSVGPCDSATCWWGPPVDFVGEVEDYDLTDMQLSVELASFDAEPGDNRVKLTWSTASETNNDHFEITRNSETVGQIAGAGTSVSTLNYEWVDDRAANGITYTYVLFAVDIHGNRQEAGTATATPNAMAAVITEYALHQNYPNPFNPETQIVFDLLEEGFVSLTVYNLTGQIVTKLVQREMSEGRHAISFRADDLPSGIYMYSLKANGFADQKKMLLIR